MWLKTTVYLNIICVIPSIHFLDVFIRLYNFYFPIFVAFIRYLFVVCNDWVKLRGMKSVVNLMIALSVGLPFLMTISLQFPISESLHAPFNRCKGRFETFFDPLRRDPTTPGSFKTFFDLLFWFPFKTVT